MLIYCIASQSEAIGAIVLEDNTCGGGSPEEADHSPRGDQGGRHMCNDEDLLSGCGTVAIARADLLGPEAEPDLEGGELLLEERGRGEGRWVRPGELRELPQPEPVVSP